MIISSSIVIRSASEPVSPPVSQGGDRSRMLTFIQKIFFIKVI
jgi:hypothetical protein